MTSDRLADWWGSRPHSPPPLPTDAHLAPAESGRPPRGAVMSGAPTAAELALALAHIRARSISHPGSPATGHYTMSDQRWRDCVAALRAAGHQIGESISAGGDRASNQTGYSLRDRPADPSDRIAQPIEDARTAVGRATTAIRVEAAEHA